METRELFAYSLITVSVLSLMVFTWNWNERRRDRIYRMRTGYDRKRKQK